MMTMKSSEGGRRTACMSKDLLTGHRRVGIMNRCPRRIIEHYLNRQGYDWESQKPHGVVSD